MSLFAGRRLTTWSCVGVVLLIAGGAWPAYNWFKGSREKSFQANCTRVADAKDWKQLEQLSIQWLAWDKNNGYAWLFLAEASQQQGDFERTAECLSRLLDQDPKCVPALLERADLLFRKLNLPLEAVATCERVLKIDPLSAKAFERLIYFYSLTLQRRQLVQLIRQSVEVRREPPQAYVFVVLAGVVKFSNGLTTIDRWLEKNPDNEAFLVARASYAAIEKSSQATEQKEDTSGNTSLMEQCFVRFPRNLEVLAFEIEKNTDAGNVERVAELLLDLPDGADLDSRFWRFSGWLHAARNELDEAEKAYREAIQANVYDWRARHALANVLRQLGRTGEFEIAAGLALKGKKLERELLELPRASQVSGELLARVAEYAGECGDRQIADGIHRRLQQ